ncbi:ATP-binding cassette sub-family A member 3 [Caerostris extrusa]|uniref:ATP-binding cassette sub-family A member 3 n=1 Tax=Caerostris extrusa TaxID=172846 RepID=A0AAV4XMG8_CAEEX|nr:ATP-binding cassette sub-family A member 3 [Caerostris extrusa]
MGDIRVFSLIGNIEQMDQIITLKKAVELGKSVPDYKVWLQRFPYPEHIDATMLFSEISIVPWVICYGYLIFIINIVRRAIEEKVNGSKKSYWCVTKPNEMDEINLVKTETSSDYFEEEPTRSLAGVAIKNLSKEFRTGMTSKLAVNDVSLNIYQGQITALLGHNGAGKTTTINILTGLYTPTSGTATINGYDILAETTKARRGYGVCPQHNVLYDTLTVEEHLKIYAAVCILYLIAIFLHSNYDY